MASFLSKNWKKILIFIAIVLVILNIINKCIAPHTLVSEYAKYGPDVEASSNINTNKIINDVKESVPTNNLPSNLLRIAIVFAVGLIAVVIIDDQANKKPTPKKK